MLLIAERHMKHPETHVLVAEGALFEVRDDIAKQLLRTAHVHPVNPPAVVYETKVILPQIHVEVAAELARFRDVHLPHDGPTAEVLGPGDSVVPQPDVPAQGVARRKRGRPRRTR